MIEEPQSTKTKIRDTLIEWGLPALLSSAPFLIWIDAVASFLRPLGWRVVTIGISVLVFGVGRLFFLLRKEKACVQTLNEKLKSDFRRRLEPVPGKGVYRDKVNGEIICPRCVANKNTPSPMAIESEYYVCAACDNMVSR